jgi:hypothetical protein
MATRLKQGKSDLGMEIRRSHYADGFASSAHLFQTLESLATVLLASFGCGLVVNVENANKFATFEIVIDASVMPTEVPHADDTATQGIGNVFVISH